MEKDYKSLRILDEINKKINTLNKTRENRIYMSKRLEYYCKKWKCVSLILNIEAVIIVTMSLSGSTMINIENTSFFATISAIFSLYVILIQSYVNEQNYSERSLKSHYHQLEIEDLILKLKSLIMYNNSNTGATLEEHELIEKYNVTMDKYQLALKNNENHEDIDNERRVRVSDKNNNVIDFSIDNIIINFNIVVALGIMWLVLSM